MKLSVSVTNYSWADRLHDRLGSLLIKAVTTLDVLSAGRAWLGIGAGYSSEQGVPESAWYPRIGYHPVGIGQFEKSHPQLAPLLATPCDFVIYHKSLSPPTRENLGAR